MALEGEERILSRLYPVPGRSGGTMASAERRFRRISVWGAGEGARKALRILVGRGCPFVLEHLVSPDGQGRVLEGYPVENPGVLTASGSLLVLAVQPDFIQPVLRRLPPGFSGPIHVFAV